MGCGESAVMDLWPIEERANEFATWVGKFDSTQRIPAAFASAADVPVLISEVKRLRAEVARPAPAWDEEAVALAVSKALREHGGWFADLPADEMDCYARAALAVVRDRLPVKPDRETVARTLDALDVAHEGRVLAWSEDADPATERSAPQPLTNLDRADAVLSLLPGRSEAEVKAEAVHEVADFLDSQTGDREIVASARLAAQAVRWWQAARAAEGGAS